MMSSLAVMIREEEIHITNLVLDKGNKHLKTLHIVFSLLKYLIDITRGDSHIKQIYEQIISTTKQQQYYFTPTNANKGQTNDIGEEIGPEWFITFSITFFKESNVWEYVVSAQTLTGTRKKI